MPELYESFLCPICLGAFDVGLDDEPDDVIACLSCGLLSPLWYLRLMGVHSCELTDDDNPPEIVERLRSTPHLDAQGREYGRTRRLSDYDDLRAERAVMSAHGYEFIPAPLR